MLRKLFLMLVLLALLAGAVAGYGYWWTTQPLPMEQSRAELTVDKGASAQGVARAVVAAGVKTNADWLHAWFRLSGQGRHIKAGFYELEQGITPKRLLEKLVNGEQSLQTVAFIEGWTFRQMREALAKQDFLHDTKGLTDAQIMAKLGRPDVHPEGRFFPDTYTFPKRSSELAVLRQAMLAMDNMLEAAWSQRDPATPLKNPTEALILASIVEKETGLDADRGKVAGVFANRLRIGMLLQTDPTVIYGLGQEYDGRLRKRHLQTDTPWNTYTRAGLPPTPIAMPGRASLLAAVKPEKTSALYFVARGDGSSQFSDNLQDHNRAVNRYIRGQP